MISKKNPFFSSSISLYHTHSQLKFIWFKINSKSSIKTLNKQNAPFVFVDETAVL